MYPDVVAAVRAAHGIDEDDDERFAAHLRTLVPSLHALRAAYRAGLDGVSVEYPREATEAYLLAYYPHYAHMARAAMALVPSDALAATDTLRITIFGSGPTPEAPGIARQLSARQAGVATLDFTLFDLQPDTWEWARQVSIERVLPLYWSGASRVKVGPAIDISAPGLATGVAADAVAGAHVIMLQNCLNELALADETLRENATAIAEKVSRGSLLLMADIGNYPNARQALAGFQRAIEGQLDLIHSPDVQLALDAASALPDIVRVNLFTGGEYPRRNPFEWRCLIARKR